MANTKDKPIKKEDLRFILQRAETQQDSLSQKLQRQLGKRDPLVYLDLPKPLVRFWYSGLLQMPLHGVE